MTAIVASVLASARRRRGLSQHRLAQAAGITRQAVGAIESARMQPSVGIALALARALDTTVEELFGGRAEPAPPPERKATAVIAGRTVGHSLTRDHLALEPAESALTTVFVAGCELSAGLLTRHATARSCAARVLWLPMTNRAALAALARGTVHAAVVHGAGARSALPSGPRWSGFEVATLEAGWLVERGNPLGLRGASDLVAKNARLANRPPGAGARRLLDEQLRRAAVDPRDVAGYEREVTGQLDAGRAVEQGFADAAVGMASVARAFGLDFLTLREERCVLVVARAAAVTAEIRTLLDALHSAAYRRDLEALRTYDVARTGRHIA